MSIATTILQQLGGNRFIAMTGASNIGCLNDELSMKLPKNSSGANYLTIELTSLDVYHLKFLKSSPAGFRAGKWHDKKIVVISETDGAYAENLQKIFTEVTGMDTHL